MRILYVVHGYPPESIGGTEIYAQSLAEQLSHKHEICVYFPTNDLQMWKEPVDKFKKIKIHPVIKRIPENLHETCLNCDTDNEFRGFLAEFSPDIVHFQHCHNLSASMIRTAGEFAGVIVTLHDYWFLCYKGILLKPSGELCSETGQIECLGCIESNTLQAYALKSAIPLIRPLYPLMHLFFKFNRQPLTNTAKNARFFVRRRSELIELLNSADVILCPSKFIMDMHAKHGVTESRMKHLPLGIDMSETLCVSEHAQEPKVLDKNKLVSSRTGKKSRKGKNVRFGYIGNFVPHKGLHLLIDAFQKVSADGNCELHIFGDALDDRKSRDYKLSILEMIDSTKIKLHGRIEHGDISRAFSQIDVLVLPSLWYENCPLVLLEALASKKLVMHKNGCRFWHARNPFGISIMASNLGGIPEILTGHSGILFEPYKAGDLEEKMRKVLHMRKFHSQKKDNITDIREHADAVENIYLKLLS